jgi:hypothetical protein
MQQAAAMANGDSAAAPQGVQHAPASAAAVGSVPRQNGAMQGPHGAVEAPQEAAASAAGTTESQQVSSGSVLGILKALGGDALLGHLLVEVRHCVCSMYPLKHTHT